MRQNELGGDLIDAIRSVEVLLEAGTGVAEAIHHIAHGPFGKVSSIFQDILLLSNEGDLCSALHLTARQTPSGGLKRFLNLLERATKEDFELAESLHKLSERELRMARVDMESFIERLSTTSDQFLLVSILLPLIAVILGVISVLTEGTMPQALVIPEVVIMGLFVLSGILMSFCIANLRRHEPMI